MFDQSSKESLDSLTEEPPSKKKCTQLEKTPRYCWNCFASAKNQKKCSVQTCEQSFHLRCLSREDKNNKNLATWKCPDCRKREQYEAFDESSSHSENINEKLQAVDKLLRDNSTLNRFDSGHSEIQEKLKAGKYGSGLEFLIDIKKTIIKFFNRKKSDAFSRCLAKALVEECEKALAPQMEHSFSDAFALIDGFASEMKKFHSRLDVKLKEATIDGKLSLHNDINRMRSELHMELLKASQEKGILESKLKAATDVYEKLQNDNMQLRTEIDAAKIDSNMLMTENVRVHSEKSSLEKEIIRMQTDFEKELHKASEEKVQLESKLNEKLLKQLENEKRLMRADYDLELIKASDEKGHLESKLSLVQTSFEKLENKNTILVEELKKASAERNTLINEMKQLLKQSEDRLKTALHELNVKKIELKKLSSENDNFLIERIQLQNEKRSLENEKDRMLTEFDGKWCKVSGEKSKLESEVSMVKTDFEKLRNDKKISDDTKHKLEEDLKKVSKERDGLLTDKVQLHNENISLKIQMKRMTINLSKLKEEKQKAEKNVEKLRIERNELVEDFREVSVDGRTLAKGDKQILEESATERRMRAELQEKLYAVVKDVNHLRLIFRPAFEIMRNSIYGVNNDLSEFKAYFERLQNKIMAQDTANKNLRIELQKVERDSLILQKDHIQLQADLNMEKSMSKIQVEAMKRQTSILDAQNIRLRIENTNLEQKIGDLKKSLEQSGMDGLSLRIQTLEQECGNLKKERDVYRARWKYVKSKPLFHKISSREESE